jgi:hypothetical protein
VTVWAAGVDVECWVVAVLLAGVAEVGAVGVATTDETAAGVLRFAWLATATVPAMVKNDAMLSPPSNQRVAAAGCRRRAGFFVDRAGAAASPDVAAGWERRVGDRGLAFRVDAARRSWSRRIRSCWSAEGVSVIVVSDRGARVLGCGL